MRTVQASPGASARLHAWGTTGPWVLMLALCLAACRSSSPGPDPLSDLRNPDVPVARRVEAVRLIWEDAQHGRLERALAREELKIVAWPGAWPVELRQAALQALLSDESEAGREDNRHLVRLMLPREPERTVVAMLAEVAQRQGWVEATPALVRSLSRPWAGVAEARRPEYRAIAALHAPRTVAEVVSEIFLDPPQEPVGFLPVSPERVRADAWDLLARLDPDGTARSRMLLTAPVQGSGPVADMRAGLHELRVLPATGEELRWLSSLRDRRDAGKRQWWDQTARVVGELDPRTVGLLQMRHLEPIRWVSTQRSPWLARDREALLEEVRRRLEGRPFHLRRPQSREGFRPAPERLRDWERQLAWGDLLTILVVDECLSDRQVQRALFAQAQWDRDDTAAEYGGVLTWRAGREGEGWRAVLYPPRPGNRRGDYEFVASPDMIAHSDHALAHYHFHVQQVRNGEFAGPSAADLAYAARFGRTCVVFTSVAADRLNADLYQPDGVVIDLGVLVRPPEDTPGR